jgi:serine/threonine-protein kinase
MPATVAPHDRAALLDALRAADLLSPGQFTRAVSLTRAGSAADAAAALVAAGLLTRFQADRLLAGRSDGFHLGPYLVLEQIGRGAHSRVYKARHRTMHRLVAIKVLAAALTDTPQHREAARAAVRAAGGLAHPNIVTAYDADEVAGRFYLVLEFVAGADLGALVKACGPMPVAEACEFVRQVAAGLQHAHERGMVHLAIKPSNLLVTRPTPTALPTVKIADFGLPKSAGACEFAAPEAAAAPDRADHRADLYSLGRVFHFLLTAHGGREVLPLAQLRPDVPPEVCAIVHRLMAHNPADRFASAAELMAHLDAAFVPVASAAEGLVNFDLPAYPLHPGQDSGFLTGRQTLPVFQSSPWAEITGRAEAATDTLPLNLERTPAPPPYRSPRRARRAAGGDAMPFWMTATMMASAVLLSLMGIGAVVKAMVK